MGFFDKARKAFSKGGVELEINSPATLSIAEESAVIQVAIHSKEEPRHFNDVIAQIVLSRTREVRNSNIMGGMDNDMSSSSDLSNQQTDTYILAEVRLGEFDIDGQATKKFMVTLPLDGLRRELAKVNKVDIGDGAMSNLFESMVNSGLNGDYHDEYRFNVTAEQDEYMDPSDSKRVDIVEAGNQGGSFGFKIM